MMAYPAWVVMISIGLFALEVWLFWFLKIRKRSVNPTY